MSQTVRQSVSDSGRSKRGALRTFRAIVLLAGTLLALIARDASAQGEPAQLIRHSAAGWLFSPVVHEGQVVGFFAVAEEGVARPGNIDTLWMEEGVDGRWAYWGWCDTEVGDAARYVEERFSDRNAFQYDGTLHWLAAHSIKAVSPARLSHGALATNASMVEAIRNLEDPSEFIGILAEDGEAVVPVVGVEMATELDWIGTTSADVLGAHLLLATECAINGEQYLTESIGGGLQMACTPPCTIAFTGVACVAPCTWTLTVVPVGERFKCEYRRPATATFTKSGKHLWPLCLDCADTGTVTGHEYAAEDVDVLPCPGSPTGAAVFRYP